LIVDTLKKEIPGLQVVYLFGSQKDDTANNESDVDVAYLTPERLSSLERWDLSQKLASFFVPHLKWGMPMSMKFNLP